MGEATDQIKHEADEARERLARDLNRLEYRVQELSNWRTWFDRYPKELLAGAFAGALLLGFSLTPRRTTRLFSD
jgi:hypothetical protein